MKFRGPFNSEQNLFYVGDVAGIKVGCEFPDFPSEAKDKYLSLARLYIDAYREYFEEEPPGIFNASYGENNLSYLFHEWNEGSGELFRIAVPFSGDGNELVQDCQFIASYRAMLEYDLEHVPEYKEGDACQNLINLARGEWERA